MQKKNGSYKGKFHEKYSRIKTFLFNAFTYGQLGADQQQPFT
jgi:hypothetical protein